MHPVSFDNSSHLRSPGSPIFWPGKTSPSSGLAEPKTSGSNRAPCWVNGPVGLKNTSMALWHTIVFKPTNVSSHHPCLGGWRLGDTSGIHWGSRSTTSAFTKAVEETLPGAPGGKKVILKETGEFTVTSDPCSWQNMIMGKEHIGSQRANKSGQNRLICKTNEEENTYIPLHSRERQYKHVANKCFIGQPTGQNGQKWAATTGIDPDRTEAKPSRDVFCPKNHVWSSLSTKKRMNCLRTSNTHKKKHTDSLHRLPSRSGFQWEISHGTGGTFWCCFRLGLDLDQVNPSMYLGGVKKNKQ